MISIPQATYISSLDQTLLGIAQCGGVLGVRAWLLLRYEFMSFDIRKPLEH